MKSLLDTNFVPEWVSITPEGVVPQIDWIQTKYLDVSYGEDDLQKVDIYLPEGEGPFPVVMLVHGGGFAFCDKRDWHLYPGFFALKEGFALVSVNYRLVPQAKLGDPIQDAIDAVAFIRANAAAYNLDQENIFLYGTSAGGNLVSQVGLRNAGTKEAVTGVASLCGLLDFQNQSTYYDIFEPVASEYVKTSRELLATYLGFDPNEEPEAAALAGINPHITQDAPPFYIQHGTMDPAVPFEQALNFAEALKEMVNPEQVTLDLLKETGHAGGGPEYLEEKNIKPILNFFKQLIK